MTSSAPSISTVLFDLGGVVCRFLPERRLAALVAGCELDPAEVQARIWDSRFDADCDAGRYTAAEIYAEVCQRLGLRLSYEQFRVAWASAWEPAPAVFALVDRLQPDLRRALLTDNGPVLHEAMPLLFPEVTRRLDPLLFSYALKARKPGPAIFERAIALLDEEPASILFIDDNPVAVEGAHWAGLQALPFTDAPALAADLAAHGLLTSTA